MPKYQYDLFGKYFKISKDKKEEITQKEYIKQTGESAYLIDKLKYSVWPFQMNDYVFLKIPNYDQETNIPKFGEHFYNFLSSRDIKVSKFTNYISGKVDDHVFYNIEDKPEIAKEKLKELNPIILKTNNPQKDMPIIAKKYKDRLRIITITEKNETFNIVDFNKNYRIKLYKKLNLNFERLGNGYAPADWQLAEMIKFLWNHNFTITGWNIGYMYSENNAFINMMHKDNMQSFFEQKLGKKNVIFRDNKDNFKEHSRILENDQQKHKNKVMFYKGIRGHKYLVSMRFNKDMIKFINDSFSVSNNKPKDIHKGNRVLGFNM